MGKGSEPREEQGKASQHAIAAAAAALPFPHTHGRWWERIPPPWGKSESESGLDEA